MCRIGAHEVDSGAFEDTPPQVISEDVAAEAEVASLVLQDRVDIADAVQLAERRETIASELHRSGGARREPEVAVAVFSERVDAVVHEAVPLGVRVKPAIVRVALREELRQSLSGGDPESPVGRLEQLIDPHVRQAVRDGERAAYDRGRVALVRLQFDKARVACRQPEMACAIFVHASEVPCQANHLASCSAPRCRPASGDRARPAPRSITCGNDPPSRPRSRARVDRRAAQSRPRATLARRRSSRRGKVLSPCLPRSCRRGPRGAP